MIRVLVAAFRHRWLRWTAALLLLIGAGCAGGAEDRPTLAASRPCLARLGTTSPVHGGAAKGALDAITLRLQRNTVLVLFAADADAATELAPDVGVTHGERNQIGSVVLAWETAPGNAEAQAVEDCVS